MNARPPTGVKHPSNSLPQIKGVLCTDAIFVTKRICWEEEMYIRPPYPTLTSKRFRKRQLSGICNRVLKLITN